MPLRKTQIPSLMAICVIPLTVLVFLVFGMSFHGPFWLRDHGHANFDPGYLYYFNALNLAIGKPVFFVFHPGTPLIVIGALLLRIFHFLFFGRSEGFLTTALTSSEFYLSAIVWTLGAINVLVLFLIGRGTFQKTGRLGLALALQASSFIFFDAMRFFLWVNFRPEFIAPSLAGVFLFILACFVYREETDKKKYALYFGVIMGIALAVKVSFMTMFLLPFFILPKGQKARYSFFVSMIFFLCTLPVLHMYQKMFSRALHLLISNGPYGTGSLGTVPYNEFILNTHRMFMDNISFIGAYIICAAAAGAGYFKRKSLVDRKITTLLAIVTVQTIGILFFAKNHGNAYYYLGPTAMLSTLGLYLSWDCFLRTRGTGRVRPLFWAGLSVILMAVILIVHIRMAAKKQFVLLRKAQEIGSFNSRIDHLLVCPVRVYARIRSKALLDRPFLDALNKYADFSKDKNVLARESSIWGNNYAWDIVGHRCMNWSQVVPCDEIIRRSMNRVVVISEKKLSMAEKQQNDLHVPLKGSFYDQDVWVYKLNISPSR